MRARVLKIRYSRKRKGFTVGGHFMTVADFRNWLINGGSIK